MDKVYQIYTIRFISCSYLFQTILDKPALILDRNF